MLHCYVEFLIEKLELRENPTAGLETPCLRDTIYTRTQTITERVACVHTSPSLRKNRRGRGGGPTKAMNVQSHSNRAKLFYLETYLKMKQALIQSNLFKPQFFKQL